MSLLVYLHVVFNQKPVTCLAHLQETWPRHGVLRVELFFSPPPADYDLQQSYSKEFQLDEQPPSTVNFTLKRRGDAHLCPKNLPVAEINVEPSEEEVIYPNMSLSRQSLARRSIPSLDLFDDDAESFESQEMDDDDDDDDASLFFPLFDLDWFNQLLVEEQHILEYSLEYGFLRLSPETRQRLKIEVLLVALGRPISRCFVTRRALISPFEDISNNTCFGSGLSRFMLDQFLGYQEILMSSIKQLAEKETHKGQRCSGSRERDAGRFGFRLREKRDDQRAFPVCQRLAKPSLVDLHGGPMRDDRLCKHSFLSCPFVLFSSLDNQYFNAPSLFSLSNLSLHRSVVENLWAREREKEIFRFQWICCG